MRRLPLILLALAVGCDFQPTLDIELPAHEAAAVINAVLVADSVAVVRLGVSRDPYEAQDYRRYGPTETRDDAVVTLLRDGQPVERLAIRSVRCDGDYNPQTQQVETYECGPYVGTVPVEGGGTYAIRAEVPGLPVAEGTAIVPRRPTVEVTEETPSDEGRRRFRVRVQDPQGDDRYGVSLIEGPYVEVVTFCDYEESPPTCVNRPVSRRQLGLFSSADPVLLAASRNVEFDDTIYRFASVADDAFQGRSWEFTMTEEIGYGYGGEGWLSETVLTVQIAALSGDVYDTYQIATFGGQDDGNPFVEPINLPSNVTGGYGLVGALALAEVTFEAPEASARR